LKIWGNTVSRFGRFPLFLFSPPPFLLPSLIFFLFLVSFSLSLSFSHFVTFCRFPSVCSFLSLCLFVSLCLSLSLTHTHTHTRSLPHAITPPCKHTHTHTQEYYVSLTLSLSGTHKLSLFLSHTSTKTDTHLLSVVSFNNLTILIVSRSFVGGASICSRNNPIEDDLLLKVGSRGRGRGQFTNPQGVCVAANGKRPHFLTKESL